MKKMTAIIGLVISFSTVPALAVSSVITCTGQAEYGKIAIQQLKISKENISIEYSVNGSDVITKTYITTEFLQKNGSTNMNKSAYLIGGTKSGGKSDYDDISLPHYGMYKSGLGSEIAFNHDSNRVFGEVSCSEK